MRHRWDHRTTSAVRISDGRPPDALLTVDWRRGVKLDPSAFFLTLFFSRRTILPLYHSQWVSSAQIISFRKKTRPWSADQPRATGRKKVNALNVDTYRRPWSWRHGFSYYCCGGDLSGGRWASPGCHQTRGWLFDTQADAMCGRPKTDCGGNVIGEWLSSVAVGGIAICQAVSLHQGKFGATNEPGPPTGVRYFGLLHAFRIIPK